MRFIIILTVVFTCVRIIQVTIPVKPIVSVGNVFRWTNLIIVGRIRVNSSNSVDMKYLSLSSREVLADKAGGKGDLSDNLNTAAPSC
jgi:hypothetical protein